MAAKKLGVRVFDVMHDLGVRRLGNSTVGNTAQPLKQIGRNFDGIDDW